MRSGADFQVPLRVHVGHDVAQLADDPGPLGHMVQGHVAFTGLVADVNPASSLTSWSR